MLGRRHDARILTDRSRWDAAAFLYFGERQNMSQRRTYSNRRKRSKNSKGVSTLFGNILVELIGFATLLIVLFFVNTTPVDSQSAQVISDRSTVSGQASNDFRAYVSELFGMPVPFAN
jgi:DNA phosphorothioation-dependent restriction protein DptG